MKPGPKPKERISTTWSSGLAYCIGLLTADGCLSKDGRHIDLTSADIEQIEVFKGTLGLAIKTGVKKSASGNLAYRTQISSVHFYSFLLSVGLTPAKSLTLGHLSIPNRFFFDFLRGYFDGDGSTHSYYDPIFPKSFRFYLTFCSGSKRYLEWLQAMTVGLCGAKGFINTNRQNNYHVLRFSKKEAVALCKKMYYTDNIPRLERKHKKVRECLAIIEK